MNNSATLFPNSISPREEMIAYEALWAIEGMTEKKMTEIFRTGVLPSSAVKKEAGLFYPELIKNVEEFFQKITIPFSIAISRDFQYPERLRQAQYPIELFYYRGALELLNSKCISIVGSRKCSSEGLRRAAKASALLVKHGYTVVSGLAEGADTSALKSAIQEGGKVIGVIGTPIDQYYPKDNKELQDEIAENHLLISQVPFYRYSLESFPFRKHNFPRRNATMSAISDGTIIIEASDTSGTLTQARAAIFQNRKLFVLNSCFENTSITWPWNYEKKGAIRVKDVAEILNHLE